MVNKLPDKYECPIDVLLYKFIDTHIDKYHEYGITPNMVTTMSIISGVLCAYFIFKGKFKLAAFFLALAYYFDCTDGKIARKFNQQSVFGDYYDHFGDLFKIIIILYALYKTNKTKLNNIKVFLIILAILVMIQFGYQEVMYSKNYESPSLGFAKRLVEHDKHPEKRIKYTRYIGSGTGVLIMVLIIANWKKA